MSFPSASRFLNAAVRLLVVKAALEAAEGLKRSEIRKIILQVFFFHLRKHQGTEPRRIHKISVLFHIEKLGMAGGMFSAVDLPG